jgi:hypothetical protein
VIDILGLSDIAIEGRYEVTNYKTYVERSLLNSIFVYTNIIGEQLVEDTTAPLIKIITTRENNKNLYVTEQFTNPFCIRCNKTTINNININLRDQEGHPIMFEDPFSKVLVTYHFRPCSN